MSFLKNKKESLLPNEAIVLCDFAENFQFLIQDEIQSYHWSKEYCTLHPLVIYFQSEGSLQHKSFCFISNDNTHDTNFVYKVQTLLMEYLKENLPQISKLYYFTDGCADDNQEEVINAITELKKRVNECENAIIKSKDK